MVRTQIQLTESQARALRDLARAEGRSVADLIRSAVDGLLRDLGHVDQESIRQRARALAGRFRSGVKDLGTGHDQHLEEAYRR
jgi:hypothetical protein